MRVCVCVCEDVCVHVYLCACVYIVANFSKEILGANYAYY